MSVELSQAWGWSTSSWRSMKPGACDDRLDWPISVLQPRIESDT